MVTTCAVTPNTSRVRFATTLFAVLSGFGAAWCVAHETSSRADRAWLALGSIFCGYGLAALLRRGQAVATECVTRLPRAKGADGLTRFPCPGMLLGGALLATLPRALGLLRFGISGFGFGLSTHLVPALASACGAGLSAWSQFAPDGQRSVALQAFACVLLAVASVCAVSGFRAAFASYVPPYRVRFEIGGLGTRIEDLTPIEEREIRPEPAIAWVVFGLALMWFGGTALPGLLLALALAPGVVVASALLSAPVVLVALFTVFSSSGILGGGAAILLALVAACEAQRIAVLDRSAAPRTSQVRGLALACLIAIVSALSALFGAAGTDAESSGSEALRNSWSALLSSVVHGLRPEWLLVPGVVLAIAFAGRKRMPVLATCGSLLACSAVGLALPVVFAGAFAAGALVALLLRLVVPAWRTQPGALDLGDLALGMGMVELGFWLAAPR